MRGDLRYDLLYCPPKEICSGLRPAYIHFKKYPFSAGNAECGTPLVCFNVSTYSYRRTRVA